MLSIGLGSLIKISARAWIYFWKPISRVLFLLFSTVLCCSVKTWEKNFHLLNVNHSLTVCKEERKQVLHWKFFSSISTLPWWYFNCSCVFSLQSCVPVRVNVSSAKQVDRSVHRLMKVWSLLWTHCYDPCCAHTGDCWYPLSALGVAVCPSEAVLSPVCSLHRVHCPVSLLELRARWPDVHGRWGDPGDPEGRGVVDWEHRYQNWNLPFQLRQTKRSRREFRVWELIILNVSSLHFILTQGFWAEVNMLDRK